MDELYFMAPQKKLKYFFQSNMNKLIINKNIIIYLHFRLHFNCPINCNPAEYYNKVIYTEEEMQLDDLTDASDIYNEFLDYKRKYNKAKVVQRSLICRIKFIER